MKQIAVETKFTCPLQLRLPFQHLFLNGKPFFLHLKHRPPIRAQHSSLHFLISSQKFNNTSSSSIHDPSATGSDDLLEEKTSPRTYIHTASDSQWFASAQDSCRPFFSVSARRGARNIDQAASMLRIADCSHACCSTDIVCFLDS